MEAKLSLARHQQSPLLLHLLFVGIEEGGGKGLEDTFPSQSHLFVLLSRKKNKKKCTSKEACQKLITVITLLLTETEAACFQESQVSYILQQ